jgi:hypothetical protein
MLAVVYATGRASHARQVKGDDPNKKGYPGLTYSTTGRYELQRWKKFLYRELLTVKFVLAMILSLLLIIKGKSS